ncbi:hypothetical protein GGR50DRAFT_670454 [Xylaria sp. CBS 124048]|nr:hypothetical protein GGR50DRAFT_670454 [Xylaria sp. CBS 124048]
MRISLAGKTLFPSFSLFSSLLFSLSSSLFCFRFRNFVYPLRFFILAYLLPPLVQGGFSRDRVEQYKRRVGKKKINLIKDLFSRPASPSSPSWRDRSIVNRHISQVLKKDARAVVQKKGLRIKGRV